MDARRFVAGDTVLYAASALAAGGVALWAGIPQFREWGRIAAPVYAGASVVAAGLLLRRRAGWDRHSLLNWLAVAVLAGAALLPLGLEATWRARTSPGFHAQSEVIVTEEAARALTRGDNPYAASFVHGPLEARPLGTKTHFPYLPGMLLFGLPRALDGSGALADARIAFAAVTLVVGALALSRPPLRRASPWSRRLSFMALAVLPTAALLMATGGDDLPVLALMLLALVLATEGRPVEAGVITGLAAVTKQTAWILLPFLALAARDRSGEPARLRFAAPAVAIAALGAVPFFAWSPSAFLEDVVRFPLGVGQQQSPAATPTLGSALIRLSPSLRTPLTIALAGLLLALVVFLLVWRTPSTVWQAAQHAGLVFVAALLLAPAARFGSIVYPVDLIVWSWALRVSSDRSSEHGLAGAKATLVP